MSIYQQDASGALFGPVELPPVPGGGILVPYGFVQINDPLPAPEPGKAWLIVGGIAEQVEDHRGPVYETQTGATIDWRELGPLPDSVTPIPRPSAHYHWMAGQWALDLEALHTAKVTEINQACETAITGGFISSALGGPFEYGSQQEDQLNLTGAILRGLDLAYPCRDEQRVKAFLPHTIEQLNQVSADFTLFKLQLLQKASELKQQLDQAMADGDPDALESVSWGSEQ
ncbi:DUF4376 domain-containing protein [Pseudomonas fluorescens]